MPEFPSPEIIAFVKEHTTYVEEVITANKFDDAKSRKIFFGILYFL